MGSSPGEVVNRLGENENWFSLPDRVPGGKLKHGVECDKRVNLSNIEGGGLEDVQNRDTRREERTEDEHEGKDEQPIGQPKTADSGVELVEKVWN